MTNNAVAEFQMPPAITRFFFALLAAMTIAAPRTATGVFIATSLIAVIYLWRSKTPLLAPNFPSLAAMAFALLALYCAINGLWAVDQAAAYTKIAILLVVLIGCYAILRVVQTGRDEDIQDVAMALAIGAGIGGLYLLIETASDQYLLKTIYNLFPVLRPDSAKQITVQNGIVTDIRFSDLNRSVAVFAFAVWPVALVLVKCFSAPLRLVVPSMLFVTAVLVSMISEHESTRVALILSAVLFLIGLLSHRAAFALAVTAWVSAFLFAVPIALSLYKAGLHNADWLGITARARVIIWDETAKKISEKPVFGIGVRSAKALDTILKKQGGAKYREGEFYARSIDRHSHNVYLQVWLELGFIGVLLMIAAGWTVLRWIFHQPKKRQPFAFAAFACAATIATFSWGIWQSWYQFSFALTLVAMALALRFEHEPSRP